MLIYELVQPLKLRQDGFAAALLDAPTRIILFDIDDLAVVNDDCIASRAITRGSDPANALGEFDIHIGGEDLDARLLIVLPCTRLASDDAHTM